MSNISAYFGETMKSGSGIVAVADYSGTTSVGGLYGPTGVGGFASGQFQFVTIAAYSGAGSSSASLAGATVNTVAGIGGLKVLGNKPQLGDPCQLFDIGEVKVVAGGALAVGQLVMSDANGRAVVWVQEEGNVPVGECRVPANSANDICTIFMYPNTAGGDSFSTQGNITAVVSPGVQLVSQMANISTGASSGVVVLPPAIPGTLVLIADDQGATHGTAITANGTDTIRGGSAGGNITTAAAHETYLLFCSHLGNWEYVKSA